MVVDEAIKTMSHSNRFSETEIRVAQEFYLNLIEPQTNSNLNPSSGSAHIRIFSRFFQKTDKPKKKYPYLTAQQAGEFVLPDKMAIGFICILSGSLLCILPFGISQGIGAGLVSAGIYAILDGVREGEEPYYTNPQTDYSNS